MIHDEYLELARNIADANDISPKQLKRALKECSDVDFLEGEIRQLANEPDIKYLKRRYMVPSDIFEVNKVLGGFCSTYAEEPFDRQYAKTAAYQAVLGDIAGSTSEFSSARSTKNLFGDNKYFTDDTVLSLATIKAIDKNPRHPDFYSEYVLAAQKHPDAGYGGSFYHWSVEAAKHYQKGYSSAANGCLMRIGYIPFFYKRYRKAVDAAIQSCIVTHNHVASVKAVIIYVTCCFLAIARVPKPGIREYVRVCYSNENEYNNLWRFHYTFGNTLEESIELNKKLPGDAPLMAQYQMCFVTDLICSGTIQDYIDENGKKSGTIYVTNHSFEDVLNDIMRIGGDTDTSGAIAGPFCYAFWRKEDFDTIGIMKKFGVPFEE